MVKISKNHLYLILILSIGLFLRALGLNWGLPQDKFPHVNTLHPDESLVLRTISRIRPELGDYRAYYNSWQYASGVLNYYLTAGALLTASKAKLITLTQDKQWYKDHPSELAKFYLVGRWLNVLLGIISIWCVYKIGSLAYDPAIGLLSAFFLSIAPNHVVNSHYLSRDMTMITCFLLSIVVFSFLSEKLVWAFFLSGFFVGLSAATKILAFSFGSVFIMAALFYGKSKIEKLNFMGWGILGSLLGFFMVRPFILLDFGEYWNALKSLHGSHLGSGNSEALVDASLYNGKALYFYFVDSLWYGLGLPLAIFVWLAFFYALFKRKKWDMILLFSIIPYLLMVIDSYWKLVRWMVAVTPILLILSARLLVDFSRTKYKKLSFGLISLILAFTLFYSLAYTWNMSRKSINDEASEWILQYIPKSSRIGVASSPYAWHPTILIHKNEFPKGHPLWKELPTSLPLINLNYSKEAIKKLRPEYIILSDFEYTALRKKEKSEPLYSFCNEVFYGGDYEEVANFKRKLKFLGLPMDSFLPYGGFLPHDWRYPFPEFKIFKRKT